MVCVCRGEGGVRWDFLLSRRFCLSFLVVSCNMKFKSVSVKGKVQSH